MKYFLWILLLCPAAGAVPCPTTPAKDEAALVGIEKAWARALDEHDSHARTSILADEFEDADIQGKLINRTATLAKVGTSRVVHTSSRICMLRSMATLPTYAAWPLQWIPKAKASEFASQISTYSARDAGSVWPDRNLSSLRRAESQGQLICAR